MARLGSDDSEMRNRFDQQEIEKLGYYVYVYTDPRNGKPFYIGKGTGNRAFSHLDDKGESAKVLRIEEIRQSGAEPLIEILAFQLDEETAFKVEAAAIDLIGFENLTNRVIGKGARQFGRRTIDSVHADLSAKRLEKFKHDCLLIRINRSFTDASAAGAMALYDTTRGSWTISRDSPRAKKSKFALAIYGGIVREVYTIKMWFPGGTTQYSDRDMEQERFEGRSEFVGRIADEKIRREYRWKDVSHYFKHGSANPIRYVSAGDTGHLIPD